MPKQLTLAITPKQAEIVTHLYFHRVLNRHHLQALLNHKDESLINKWLTDLTKKQIIHAYRESATSPTSYCLLPNSKFILKTNELVNPARLARIYEERARTERFRNHYLLVADVLVAFIKVAREIDQNHYIYSRAELSDHEYMIQPPPHLLISLQKKRTIRRYFIEVFDPKLPKYVIRKRIRNIISYAKSGEWEDETNHPFPMVVLVTPTEDKQKYVARQLRTLPEEDREDLAIRLIPSTCLGEVPKFFKNIKSPTPA